MKLASAITYDSVVDGPGLRNVIWTQGCPHHCKGCQNPETWNPNSGYNIPIDDIIKELKKNYSDSTSGVTISGGDPLFQMKEIMNLCKEIKKEFPNWTIWIYTGFLYEKLQNNVDFNELMNYFDVLVDGPFILKKRDISIDWTGSSNQRVIDIRKSKENNDLILYK